MKRIYLLYKQKPIYWWTKSAKWEIISVHDTAEQAITNLKETVHSNARNNVKNIYYIQERDVF